MATTISAVVYAQHGRADGTYNVKFKIYHKEQRRLMDTQHFVTSRQLTKDFEIKDTFVKDQIEEELREHRKSITGLGKRLQNFTAENLRDYLQYKNKDVDFIAFCRSYYEGMKEDGREAWANHRTVVNSLVDFFERESVLIEEINMDMLLSYEKYLKAPRTLVRRNRDGLMPTVSTRKGLKKGGLYNHMRDLRTMFNEARRKYNNPNLGIVKIPHYPFKDYIIGSKPKTRKRNLFAEQIRIIRDCQVRPGSRAEMTRDLFMLSFYMCGTNAVDMYNHLDDLPADAERWEYCRSKTYEVAGEDAFISIRIVPQARAIMEKYKGTLKSRYTKYTGLDAALFKGVKELRKLTGIPEFTFYWARHSFATIARNKCGVSKDDVGMALNHTDEEHATTDIYIEVDWSIVDRAQELVIAYLNTGQAVHLNRPNARDVLSAMSYEELMALVAEKFVQSKNVQPVQAIRN